METFLHLRDIAKSFGPIEALRGIDLDLERDELLVVLGPTGAGKTTLLRIIAGLEEPDRGSVEMEGVDVTSRSPADRDVAFVFQNFSLYPDWTVRRNMEFPLRAPGRDLEEREIDERVEWAASLLRIEALLDRPSANLSGGEMQRVAIGRALLAAPRFFLMDEPLTNLDAKLRESLRVELAVLRRELGIPLIYVTHDQAEALSMGDRIAVLSEGRILQIGSPEEVYRKPVSPVVARQLGQPSINLLEVKNVDGRWVVGDGIELMATEPGFPGEMLLGVRPEDISSEGGSEPGKIRVVEDTGPNWILLVDWAGSEIHLAAGKERNYSPGDEIFPQIDPERAVLWERDGN